MKPLFISIVAVSCLTLSAFFYLSTTPETVVEEQKKPLTITNEHSSNTTLLLAAINIKNVSERQAQLVLLFTKWIAQNPLNAIELIQQLDTHGQRSETFNIALQLWANIDLAGLNEWLSSQEPNSSMDLALSQLALAYSLQADNSAISNFLTISLANYPQAVFFADNIFSAESREESVFRAIYSWIEDSPNSAVQWSIEQQDRTEEWLTMLFIIMAPEFPVAAVNSLHLLEPVDDTLIDLAIQLISTLLIYENYDSELDLAIQSLTPYNFRERLISAIIPGLFAANILSLAEIDLLISSLLPGSLRDELQQRISFSWASRNPEEAAAYAEGLTGESRAKALDAVVVNWAISDIESTSVWLESVEGDIDLPARSLSKVGAREFHLEIADTWANNISDDISKSEAFRDVYLEWNKTHPLNAAHYIISHRQLNEDQKIQFLQDGVPNSRFASVQEIVDFFELPED